MADAIRVLYVDDEPGLLEIARIFLEQTGEFTVMTSISAPDALASPSLLSCDAIIADYQMPGMDGIAFLKAVRQRSTDLPFILFTGKGREEVVIDAINNGADFYLQKGGQPKAQFAELAHKIRQAVRRRAVERDLQLIFRNMINAFVVWESVFDENGRYVSFRFGQFNDAYARIAKVKQEDVRGKDVFEVWPATEQSWVEAYGSVATTGAPRVFDMYHEPTKGWYHCNAYRPTDSPAQVCVIFEDITERRRDEAELRAAYEQVTAAEEELRSQYDELSATEQRMRESGAKYRELVENANSIILQLDKTGTVTFFNEYAQWFFQYTPDEIIGRPAVGTIVPATESESGRNLQLMMDEIVSRPDNYFFNENENITRDGRRVWIRWHNKPILDKNGQLDGVLSIGTDITQRRQDEETLRESEEKYRLVVENSQDAIYIHRSDRLVFVNSRATELTGYSHDELMKKRIWDLIHPDDRNELIERAKKRFAGHEVPPGFTARLLIRDGTERFCEFIVDLVMYQGAPAILGIARDITERRHVEEALQKSEEKYRELVENANSIILKMDETGTVTFFNEFAQRFFGYTNDEIIGKPVVGTIVPATESESGRNLRTLLEDIVRNPGPYLFNENENITRDGKRVWIRWHNKPLLDRNGQPAGVLSIGTDITGRRQAEEALQKARDLLNTTEHLAKIGGWELDVQSQAVTWTEEMYQIHEMDPADFGPGSPGHAARSLACYDQRDRPLVQAAFERCQAEGKPYSLELPFTTAKRRKIWIRTMGTPVTENGRVVRVIGNILDITDIKRAEEALRQANRKLNLLSGITRHDINNQLLALNGFIGLLQQKVPGESYTGDFSRINATSRQIANLIEFTREYEEIGIQAPRWQDLHTLVDTAARDFLLGKVTLNNDLPGATVIFADPLIIKVFSCLVDNALRHGGRITTIRFSLEEQDGDRVIVCEDDGEGVAAGEKEKIFDLGFGKNTGFGLALAREVLSITGMTITENGEPGKGARFRITVPAGAHRVCNADKK
jgi:PAS domain S-box-containing protein